MTGWSVSSGNGGRSPTQPPIQEQKSAKFTTWDDTAPYSAYVFASQSIAYDSSTEYTLSVTRGITGQPDQGSWLKVLPLKLEYYNSSLVLLRTDQRTIALAKITNGINIFSTRIIFLLEQRPLKLSSDKLE